METAIAPKGKLDYQPEVRPVAPAVPVKTAAPLPPAAAPRQASPIDLTKGRGDITQSYSALTEKYGVSQFTLATADGLVFASSGSASAQTDAAVFSGEYAKNPSAQHTGVILFGLEHKGSQLIGIVRTKTVLPEGIVRQIIADTKDILNWWI